MSLVVYVPPKPFRRPGCKSWFLQFRHPVLKRNLTRTTNTDDEDLAQQISEDVADLLGTSEALFSRYSDDSVPLDGKTLQNFAHYQPAALAAYFGQDHRLVKAVGAYKDHLTSKGWKDEILPRFRGAYVSTRERALSLRLIFRLKAKCGASKKRTSAGLRYAKSLLKLTREMAALGKAIRNGSQPLDIAPAGRLAWRLLRKWKKIGHRLGVGAELARVHEMNLDSFCNLLSEMRIGFTN